jgi:tetratricopeptide (TPR) repeat protein
MMRMPLFGSVVVVAALAGACGPDAPAVPRPFDEHDRRPQATSLLGTPLFAPPLDEEDRARLQTQLDDARAQYSRSLHDPEAAIWLGRRTAYLGRYREAISIFTETIRQHPDDPRPYRHRGHRYITVRELDRAIADLERASELMAGRPSEVEPDGQPNARNIPTSTLQSNVWYHLALARYLTGDFSGAAADWQQARDALDNPDNLVAASHWLYLASRRAGRAHAELEPVLSPIRADLDVIENTSYLSLLLLYKGERSEQDVLGSAGAGASRSAVRYGVGAWHLVNGRADEAHRIWRTILEGQDWPSFGFIAAEAEIARRSRRLPGH